MCKKVTNTFFASMCIYFRSGYVCIQGMNASAISRRKQPAEPILEKYVFIPNEATLSHQDSVRVNIQIVLENFRTATVTAVELIDTNAEVIPLAPLVREVLSDFPLIQLDVKIFSQFCFDTNNISIENKKLSDVSNVCIVIGQNLLTRNVVSISAQKSKVCL